MRIELYYINITTFNDVLIKRNYNYIHVININLTRYIDLMIRILICDPLVRGRLSIESVCARIHK